MPNPARTTLFSFVSFALVAVMGLILLAGCAEQSAPLPPTATPAPVIDGPIVIPFFTTEADPGQLVVLQSLVNEYQKLHPNVEIDIILASPASRGRRLLTALASGADLGIFEIEPTLMTDWIDAGYLLPLDSLVEAIGEQDYVEGSLFRYRDHVYAIPYAISVYGLWVRTDLLAQAGLPLPRNYDELLTTAATLSRGETYGIALPGGQNIASVNYFSTFLWQNGGDYFDCRGNVIFDSPQALIAVQKWTELTQYAPPGFTVWGYKEQIDAFLRGRVAMAMYGGRLGVAMDEKTPELADRVALIFPPWGEQQVTLGVWSRFAIAAGTRHQDEAKAFLQWLVSGDRLLRYDMTVPGHMIPPLRSVQAMALQVDSPYVAQHSDWMQAFQQWVPYTNHPAMNMGSLTSGHFRSSHTPPPWADPAFAAPGVIGTMLQEISLGGQDPVIAWQQAVQRLQQTVADWKARHPQWQAPDCSN